MNKQFKVLVINPGSTSTKLALFAGKKALWLKEIKHSKEEIAAELKAQYPIRKKAVENTLRQAGLKLPELSAVISRGAPLKPLKGGTYSINDQMLEDLKNLRLQSPHISYLGGIIARELAELAGIPAFTADPISIDEYQPLARYSGHPEIPRKSLWHALNCRSAAQKAGEKLKKPWKSLNLIVAHLGGGISVVAFKKGKAVDSGNANSEGPFSPQRTGGLPSVELLEWLKAKNLAPEKAIHLITHQGGLLAYLGSSSAPEIEAKIRRGDKFAREVYQAMAYQIAKQVGALAVVLKGKLDAVVLTGNLANSRLLTGWLKAYLKFLAPILLFPGEDEMKALAEAAFRVLEKKEKALSY